jgi:hypothetical protein
MVEVWPIEIIADCRDVAIHYHKGSGTLDSHGRLPFTNLAIAKSIKHNDFETTVDPRHPDEDRELL